MAKNTICHFELMCTNPARTKEFYGTIFGWKYKDMGPEMGGYQSIDTGGELGGGMMQKPEEVPQPALNVYFLVDDADATLQKVRDSGGRVINEKTPIPGMGSWAMFLDPDGICIGIYEDKKS